MTEPTPTVLRRRDALARGFTDGELRATCRNGGMRRLRPGTYLNGDVFDGLDAAELHRELIRATLPGVSADAVVSHQSAAVLHRLPVWALPLERVHVTRDRCGGGKRTRHLHSHSAPLPSADVVRCDGVAVTSVARTVADLCRTAAFEAAVVVGDAGLRAAKLSAAAVVDALAYAERRPGHPAARRALGFLDARSESVGESRSRVALAAHGFEPALQASLMDADNRFLGRVDFLLSDAGVVGEFDGKIKYGKYLRDGQDPGDAVFAEKQREDSIRDMGWEVARWTWRDLSNPAVIDARIRRALRRRDGRPRPLGTVLLPN